MYLGHLNCIIMIQWILFDELLSVYYNWEFVFSLKIFIFGLSMIFSSRETNNLVPPILFLLFSFLQRAISVNGCVSRWACEYLFKNNSLLFLVGNLQDYNKMNISIYVHISIYLYFCIYPRSFIPFIIILYAMNECFVGFIWRW